MADSMKPRTSISRGPRAEEPIDLDRRGEDDPEVLSEAGGDTEAYDVDANVGGASATRGLDSGGAVGVRLGREVGRPGFEYDDAPRGMTTADLRPIDKEEEAAHTSEVPAWAEGQPPFDED